MFTSVFTKTIGRLSRSWGAHIRRNGWTHSWNLLESIGSVRRGGLIRIRSLYWIARQRDVLLETEKGTKFTVEDIMQSVDWLVCLKWNILSARFWIIYLFPYAIFEYVWRLQGYLMWPGFCLFLFLLFCFYCWKCTWFPLKRAKIGYVSVCIPYIFRL
jgi:hypothetical protein